MPAEAQCAMCRAVLENEEGQGTAKGINKKIFSLPFGATVSSVLDGQQV